MRGLHAQPVLGGAAEGLFEADRQLGGDRRAAFADGCECILIYLEVLCGVGDAEPKRLNAVFEQRFARVMRDAMGHWPALLR